MSWLPCTAPPASPARWSPRMSDIPVLAQPSEQAGAAQDPIVQGGEHPDLPMQKPAQCHSQGLFPQGRGWGKGCSFLIPFHLCQELSAVQCSRGKRKRRQPTEPAAPASTAQLTGSWWGNINLIHGNNPPDLLQCASRRHAHRSTCCTGRLSQSGGTGRGEHIELLLPLPSPLSVASSPAMRPHSMKHCFGNSRSLVESTGRWCGNI